MKILHENVAYIIAQLLISLNCTHISKPTYDFYDDTISFKVYNNTDYHLYELNMYDILKLHDYKLQQYVYKLVKEYNCG